MAKKGQGNTVSVVWNLAQSIAEELGLDIWDIKFVKEGALWYLRIFIDKPEGISIDDCEKMSRAIDKPLDELDPIEQEYISEVSSPGIERELTRAEHFEAMSGMDVSVKLYRPIDGQKEIIAKLTGLNGTLIELEDLDGTPFSIDKKDAISVKLYDVDIFGGTE